MKNKIKIEIGLNSEIRLIAFILISVFLAIIFINIANGVNSIPAMIICISEFVFIPCLIMVLYTIFNRTTIDGDTIIIKKWNHKKKVYSISDIDNITIETVEIDIKKFKQMTIAIGDDRLVLDSSLDEYNSFYNYIIDTVDSTKIIDHTDNN